MKMTKNKPAFDKTLFLGLHGKNFQKNRVKIAHTLNILIFGEGNLKPSKN